MATIEPPRAKPFHFWPPIYEEVRLEGLTAYRTWLEVYERWDLAKAGKLIERAEEEMPLAGLIRQASFTRGILRAQDDSPPRHSVLVDWLTAYEADFIPFFPDQMREEAPREEAWSLSAKGALLWEQIEQTSQELAEATEVPSSEDALFFVLIRDHLVEIAPMVEGAGIDMHSLVVRARADMLAGGPSKASVQATVRRLRADWKANDSAALLFAAFIRDGTSHLAAEIKPNFGMEALREYVEGPSASERIRPQASLQIRSRAVSDLPARDDHLGVAPLVQGLHALLTDPGTSLPLAIAVTAPWGGGKSSLMLQLEDELASQVESGARTWIPIRFDAWKYERSERLWAALGKAIYSQPQERWSWTERVRFKTRLQWRRAGGLSFFLTGVILPLALAFATVALAVAKDALVGATLLGAVSLLALGNSATRVFGLVSDPFKRALDRYVKKPQYEEHLGFTAEADSDIAQLIALLTEKPGSALAIFIDDLDRCSPVHVVEVVEAINQIFNYDAQRQCVFILGMDREIVAASIEVAYEKTIERLSGTERGEDFGFSFLAKLVQLSVAIPRPGPGDVEELLDAMSQASDEDPEPDPQEVEKVAELISEQQPADPAAVERIAERIEQGDLDVPDRALDEAKLRERSKALSGDSRAVQEARREVARYLNPNPREVKRFDNAFRLQLQVANRTPGCTLEFNLDDLVALGKWVVLRLRWPGLAERLDSDPRLLNALENRFNGILDEEAPADLVRDPVLWKLLQEPLEGRRIGRLLDHTFLRVS